MKKMMMIVAMAVCCMAANAQNEVGQLTLQPKIGLNLANITDIKVKTHSLSKDTESGSLKSEFAIGLEAEYGLAEKFSVAAGVLYSRQGTDLGEVRVFGNPDGSVSEGWDKYQISLGYLNIPVVANFYFAKGWAIKAGIQPGFLLSAKRKVDGLGATKSEDVDLKDTSKSFDLSIPLGISYEFNNHIVIDGRYNLGVTKINKNGEQSCKNGVIQLTLGYKFAL